jgi:hypothetical protein
VKIAGFFDAFARVAAAAVVSFGCSADEAPPPREHGSSETCDEPPNDCGGCGTACDDGGTCRSGYCDIPLAIATSQHNPWNIARDDVFLYWTSYSATTGKVLRAPRDAAGGGATELARAQSSP